MKEEVKAKKPVKLNVASPATTPVTTPAVMPAATLSLALRFLRKKDGSTILQEGVNDVWADVPMVVEK
jgi:hypothetical protein